MNGKVSRFMQKLKENKYFGFTRSFAVLLLAVVMLVTSVLAWFTANDSATATGLSVSTSVNGGVSASNSGITLDETVVLPAATKPTDSTISAADLAKVIVVRWYKVTAPVGTAVNVAFDMNADGLRCYCFSVLTEQQKDAVTPLSCATAIKNDATVLKSQDFTMSPNIQNGECYVIVAYLADYDTAASTLNSSSTAGIHTYNMGVKITFTPAS